MKQRSHISVLIHLSLLLLVGIFTVAQSGCEKIKGERDVIGFPQSFADLSEKVSPAVVNISTEKTVTIPGSPFRHFFGPNDPFGDFFRGYFDQDIPDREMKQQSLGSGFIIDREGHIITNNHVVEGADDIKVKLTDGREFKAKVIGRDQKTDIALIKISSLFKDLPALPLGDSDKIRVGDWVLAIGSPFGLEHTVTKGIISATGRVIGSGPYDNFLQTDAPINPGNSGGPLINLRGEVVGINTAIIASGQGIGFAIPSNMAKSVVSQIKDKGKVTRGWIGVSVQTISPDMARALELKEATGALVNDVVTGGPAEAAGLKRGDVIIAFDGRDIKNMSDLPMIVANTPAGKTADVRVIRDGKTMDVKITVSELSDARQAQAASLGEGLGMTLEDVTPRLQREFGIRDKIGVVVAEVVPGSPAAAAGLQAGDLIREVNRMPVSNVKGFAAAVQKRQKGKAIIFLIQRGGQTFFVSMSYSP